MPLYQVTLFGERSKTFESEAESIEKFIAQLAKSGFAVGYWVGQGGDREPRKLAVSVGAIAEVKESPEDKGSTQKSKAKRPIIHEGAATYDLIRGTRGVNRPR